MKELSYFEPFQRLAEHAGIFLFRQSDLTLVSCYTVFYCQLLNSPLEQLSVNYRAEGHFEGSC